MRPPLLLALLGLLLGGHALLAEPAEPSPQDLRSLAELLRKPAIQGWLQSQAEAQAGAGTEARAEGEPAPRQTAAVGPAMMDAGGAEDTRQALTSRLDMVRAFLRQLAAAAPLLPGELASAVSVVSIEARQRGPLGILLLLATFAVLGFGLEWLFWWATTGMRRRMIATPLEDARGRLRAVALRTVYGLGVLMAFALGSVGAFLLFDWPPFLRQIVLAYLLVFLIVRLLLVLGRILLAPGAERFRVVPMRQEAARFWFVWATVLVGWFFFVQFSLDLLATLSMSRPVIYLVGLGMGIVLLALALYALWRHPEREVGRHPGRERWLGRALVSAYLVLVWLLLLTGSVAPFYVGVILLLLPIAIRGVNLSVAHLLHPPGEQLAEAPVPSLMAIWLDRGLRALVLIGGAYLIAWVLGLDVAGMTMMQDTLPTRIVRGFINVVVIFFLVDLLWHLARAWIDGRLARAAAGGGNGDEEARQRARLMTLLPVFKNILFAVLMVMAALMALAAMGVEIGPLLAGAGVFGVAVGFGAQTLVKDIISGIFYLLDDAFRVGEYIQSGGYKGTVESFSLRSVKLRHQRGPLTTVPFGSLGAIQNLSRDWVIDKIALNVTYDTDLDKVKRAIKEVSREIMAEPELALHILQPLKSQGVYEMGDFAIVIRMKFMAKPGEQFTIRRAIYAKVKKAFDAAGIKFAFPTVTVAGNGEEAEAAVAQKAVQMTRPAPAEA